MEEKWDSGMATPDHNPQGRGFDTSLHCFKYANDCYAEQVGKCSEIAVVDLWDSDKPDKPESKLAPMVATKRTFQ